MLWRPPLESKRMYFQNYDYAVRSGAESSYKRMLYHSISPLIIFCHFLINSVTKPFSTKMTENNQSFFPFFPNILTQKNQKI